MRALVPFLALALPTFWVLHLLRIGRRGPERIGLSLLLGIGAATTLLFLAAAAGMPLRPTRALLFLAPVAVAAILLARRLAGRGAAAAFVPGPVEASQPSSPRSGIAAFLSPPDPWTPAEVLLLLVSLALLAVAFWRADFYPVWAMDAHSYDGRARWIVEEGTLKLSIYRDLAITGGGNLAYPPVYPLALVLGYWAGAAHARSADVLYLAALLLVLYGTLRVRLPRLGALAAVFLVTAAPEAWLNLSLGLTNIPAMAFLAAGVLLAVSGLAERRRADTIVAGVLFAFAAGVRTDAIVLATGVAVVLTVIDRRRGRSLRPVLSRAAWLLGPAIGLAIAWQLYLRSFVIGSSAGVFRKSLLPDGGLLLQVVRAFFALLLMPGLYGWTVAVLLLGVVLAAWRRPAPGPSGPGARDSSPAVAVQEKEVFLPHLLVVATLAVVLIALFQQIDPSFGGGGGSYLRNSLKRAVFYLIPGAVATGCLSPPLRALLWRIDAWQRS